MFRRKISLSILSVLIVLLHGLFFAVAATAIDTENRTVVATGTIGEGGAEWTLYDDGVIEVGGGIISHDGASGSGGSRSYSLWNDYKESILKIVFTKPVVAGEELRGLFARLPYLTYIENMEYIDTSNVVYMTNMFRDASSLTSLDLSNWDTGNVRYAFMMFLGTSSLTSLDVSNWDTSNMRNINHMFDGTGLIELDLSSWDTSSVTDMNATFQHARYLTYLNVSNWDTSNVWRMFSMFRNASSLTTLDLSSWDTSSAREMAAMFLGMHSLNILSVGIDFNITQGTQSISGHGPELPLISKTNQYTGYWQNLGDGTPENPTGELILTSSQLISRLTHGRMRADTWVWQRWSNRSHMVQSGDTLYELSQRFQTTVIEFVRLNNIENPNLILVGQVLMIPEPRIVTVQFYYYDVSE